MSEKVIIIGGGAAGLMAAISSAKQGANVTVLEHSERVGKKILSTGNGKCNLTNTSISKNKYYGGDKLFIENILKRFNVENTLNFFSDLGVLLKNKNGYIYPMSEQASTVLNALRFKCEELEVKFITGKECNKIEQFQNGFKVEGVKYNAVILATGGMSAPKTGSDGTGYSIAKRLGHTIIKPQPALVALKCEEGFYKALAGIRTTAELKLFIDDTQVADDKGELQLTSYGISGIPVFQISHFATRALNKTKNIYVYIDFLPDYSSEELIDFLSRSVETNIRTPEEHLSCILNKKLASVIFKESKASKYMTIKDISSIVNKIKKFKTKVISSNSFENAQVTSGGISTIEIDSNTMESKLIKNLYFAGEIMDVNGICGGYNLQWAWSTGYIAGEEAGRNK